MAAKMGGDQPNMNSSSPVIDPSLYGFGGQKRSLDNGGKPSLHTQHGSADCSYISASQLLCLKLLPAEHVDSFIITPPHCRTEMWPSSACPNCVCLCLFVRFCSTHSINSSLKIRLNCFFVSLCSRTSCHFRKGCYFCPNQSVANNITTDNIFSRDESCSSCFLEHLSFKVIHTVWRNMPI